MMRRLMFALTCVLVVVGSCRSESPESGIIDTSEQWQPKPPTRTPSDPEWYLAAKWWEKHKQDFTQVPDGKGGMRYISTECPGLDDEFEGPVVSFPDMPYGEMPSCADPEISPPGPGDICMYECREIFRSGLSYGVKCKSLSGLCYNYQYNHWSENSCEGYQIMPDCCGAGGVVVGTVTCQ